VLILNVLVRQLLSDVIGNREEVPIGKEAKALEVHLDLVRFGSIRLVPLADDLLHCHVGELFLLVELAKKHVSVFFLVA